MSVIDRFFRIDGLPMVSTWGGGNFTSRATARVGRLMLRKGNWNGQQLIAPTAVEAVTTDAGRRAGGDEQFPDTMDEGRRPNHAPRFLGRRLFFRSESDARASLTH